MAFDTDIDVAKGDNDYQAVIISVWPSKAAARAFWGSPEYAAAIKLRDGIGEFDVVMIKALDEGSGPGGLALRVRPTDSPLHGWVSGILAQFRPALSDLL